MEKFYDFDKKSFLFEGREAIIVFPKKADKNKNWLLKTEYWDAFPETELEMVERGFHLAYVQNSSRFATYEDCELKKRFVEFLSLEYGLSDKCVPVGMSLGGAHAINFAGFFPECVKCIFLDAPVLNFLSYPGRYVEEHVWKKEFIAAYPGITRAKLLDDFKYHPIKQSFSVMENNIPIVMLYGTQDKTVIYEENGQLLEEVYENKKDLLLVIQRGMQGHHPHGFLHDKSPLINFILKHTKGE